MALRIRPWHAVVGAILLLAITAFASLAALQRHNRSRWRDAVASLEAQGYPCTLERWLADHAPVDEPRQERLWAILQALPELAEPKEFGEWLAGTRADP